MAFELVAIGTSMGGLDALEMIFANLPRDFPAAVAVVQHRHQASDRKLSVFLQQYSAMPLKDAEDKEEILPGWIYLAPANYHLLIETRQNKNDRYYYALSTEASVSYARPSINVLFESVADAYKEKVIGIILTGASDDGARGLAKIKQRGGLAIVQEPATAESRTMPEAAIATVAVDRILPLQAIAPFLIDLCQPA